MSTNTHQSTSEAFADQPHPNVRRHVLKDFMRQAGEVVFADVLLLPNGMSKVSGIMAGHSAFLG